MITIIAGSRIIDDPKIIAEGLSRLPFVITEVVSGGARGVDRLGEQWAEALCIPVKQFKPDWSVGRQAGVIRNMQMADYAEALVAFWDGMSHGTDHMIRCAKEKGLGVTVFIVKDGLLEQAYE